VILWWIWLHIVGALLFVTAHGVSMGVSFRLRRLRDPRQVSALLDLSATATKVTYVGLLVLLMGGVVAGFKLHAWGRGWIWTAIAILVFTIGFMYGVATRYYIKVRTVTQALVDGSEAVTPAQYAEMLSSNRAYVLAAEGIAALLVIVWLMVLKPF
jgi:uncharacterized membrane protein